MPSWPTQSDYKDALQNPDTAFRDPDLKASQAERSPMGVPRARSGAFASVYKMTRGPKSVALKLFNFPNADRAGRYQAVSDYLKKLGPKKPTAMVGFEYHPEGIRVGKAWYPTLTMEWVRGKALGEWVREAMERRNPDVAAVRATADAWARLVGEIQAAQIAHGDLQHDNVMVVGNQLILVDYDGMCVPALAPADPRKRLEQLEFGKPAYQHPARANEKLGPHLDHFAAWVILIALRATAADPGLYARFVTRTANENLLFIPPDMATPEKSELWPELLRCKDTEVRDWARIMRTTLNKPYRPFDQLPSFTLDPVSRLRRLTVAVPRDWAAVAAEADALTHAGKVVPPDLKAIAADAVKRVTCRDAVKQALDAKNPRAVKAAFVKPLLEGWADARLIADAEAAASQVAVLDKLKTAMASPGDGRALVKLWAAEGSKVAGIPEAESYRADDRAVAGSHQHRGRIPQALCREGERSATGRRLAARDRCRPTPGHPARARAPRGTGRAARAGALAARPRAGFTQLRERRGPDRGLGRWRGRRRFFRCECLRPTCESRPHSS